MVNNFNFFNIKQYNKYVINISKKDYKKMQESISILKEKYNTELLILYELEKQNLKQFNFNIQY